jgi:hypothetical protein
MKKQMCFLCLVVCLGVFFITAARSSDSLQDSKYSRVTVQQPDVTASAVVERVPDFGEIPLYFIPNRGQVDGKACFYAKTSWYTLWMTKEALVFDSIRKKERADTPHSLQPGERDVSRLIFTNANKNPGMVPVELTQHRVNYIIGNDSRQWRTNIRTSRAVLYKNIYKNIDLKVYGVEKQIEYDWLVKPGGNPADIGFKYENAAAACVDNEGNLVITTRLGKLVHKKPVSYQWIKGEKLDVHSEFRIICENTYGFTVDAYNRNYELLIDPLVSLEYSTYLGGSRWEGSAKVAADQSGYIYVTGTTESSNFPVLNAFQRNNSGGNRDVFVTKFGPAGQNLVFSTYYGGTGSDNVKDIVLSKEGAIYIAGDTSSEDLPAVGSHYGNWDAFVAGFTGNGFFVKGRYVSGRNYDTANAVALDNSNNVFITGETHSGNFYTTPSAFQGYKQGINAFICKFDPGLDHIIYSTYLGGNDIDIGVDIGLDNSGYFYVTGHTKSDNFPDGFKSRRLGNGERYDIFACKFKPDGSNLVYSTIWGGDGNDYTTSMALDSSGSVYVGGNTNSSNFPTKNAIQDQLNGVHDVVFTKLKPDGSDFLYSTYFGGSYSEDFPVFIAVDRSGYLYAAGSTGSYDFPMKNAFENTMSGISNGFFSVIASDGAHLLCSSFLGSTISTNGFTHYTRCSDITLDRAGNVHITGITNCDNFPLKDPYQAKLRGDSDVFVSKFSFTGYLTVSSSSDASVPITVSPADQNGNGSGNTDFKRKYNLGTVVTLTAPGTFNGKSFSKWSIDGTDHFTRTVTLPIAANSRASVTYVHGAAGKISLDTARLCFGVCTSGSATSSQGFFIDNSGSGTIDWTVSDDASWLDCSPSSGTNAGEVTVSVDGTGFTAGGYTGTITVSSPNAGNSPQTIEVTMVVYDAHNTATPIGWLDTPGEGATVRGSIPVTGWALDNIEVKSVKIYREDNKKKWVYIGDAVFVEGARPDVQQKYPDYPLNSRAGWGYMLLTNFLPGGGNGTYTLWAAAVDAEGQQVALGAKTIICDNANAVKPFGAIDTPTQGGSALGSSYVNWGWVLTPQPNYIPTDGSTINVWVDGLKLGHPTYNIYRADIAGFFPGYANSNGAVGYFYLDTTTYSNGVHTIQWTAADNAGNTDGIGSRYFTIQNSSKQTTQDIAQSVRTAAHRPLFITPGQNFVLDTTTPVGIVKGYETNVELAELEMIYPNDQGMRTVEIKQLERIELHFGSERKISGWMVVGKQLHLLPVGSYIDLDGGIFCWQTGTAFLGKYQLIFIEKDPYGTLIRKNIVVKIKPKF